MLGRHGHALVLALFFPAIASSTAPWSGGNCSSFLTCTTNCPAGHSCTPGQPTSPCGADNRFSPEGITTCSTCAAGSRTSGGTRATRFRCSATDCPAGHSCNGTSVATPCGRDNMYAAAGDGLCRTCAAGSRTAGGGGPSSRERCVQCPREPAGACNGTSAHLLPALCQSPPGTPSNSKHSEKLDAADCAAFQDFWDVLGGWGTCDGADARNGPCSLACSPTVICRDPSGGSSYFRINTIRMQGNTNQPANSAVPVNFLDDVSRITGLHKLLIQNVGLTATLPHSLGALTGLKDLNLDNNKFFGQLPPAWGSLSQLTLLSLRNNNLDGELPSTWSGMAALRTLKLENNGISGKLPAAWGALPDISQLYLQHNRIGGPFPAEWAQLMRPRPPSAPNGLLPLQIDNNEITGLMPEALVEAIESSGRSAGCGTFRARYNRWMCPFPANFQQATWSSQCGLDCCGSGTHAVYRSNGVFLECANCTVGANTAAAANCGQCGCSVCPLGQFGAVANASTCTLCPAGKYSSDVTGALACGGCDRGQFSPAGSVTCLPCARGQFAELTESAKCSLCPPNTYQDKLGQVDCKSCASHNRSTPTTSGAVGADSATLCVAAGDSRRTCPPGESANAAGDCALCKPGQFKAGVNKEPCTQCTCGSFSEAGATACDLVCAAGYFGNVTSATCDACPASHFCIEGRARPYSDAKECSAGQSIVTDVSVAADRVCAPCAPGHFSSVSNSLSCTACTAGTFQPGTGQIQCLDCSPGTFQNDTRASACLPCPTGRFANAASASHCDGCDEAQCEAGSRVGCGGVSAGVCVNQCPAGTFFANATQECQTCPEGYYCLGGLKLQCGSAAVFCPSGSDRPIVADTRKCTVASESDDSCSVSTLLPSSTMVAQRECSTGHYCEGGRMKLCERGFSCSEGKRTPCHELGTFCPETGLKTAKLCPSGTACTSEGVLRDCDRNEYSDRGRCVRCDNGEFVRGNRCVRCPSAPVGAVTSAWALRCLSGFAQLEDENFYCAACLREQESQNGQGLHLDHAVLRSSAAFIRCPLPGVCKLALNASDYRLSMNCASAYTGALCGVCASGFGSAGTSCVPCPAGWVIPSCGGIGVVAFLVAFVFCVRAAFVAAEKNHASRHLTMTSLSILLSFLFETSLLASYQLDWGQTMRTVFGISSAAATGDVTSIAMTDCIGLDLHSKMKLVFAAPFMVAALPVPAVICLWKRGIKQVWSAPIWRVYQTAVVVSLWLIHPAVMRECLLALLKTRVGDEEYVAADLAVNVNDPQYALTKNLAMVMMCTFVPLWPCAVFAAMFRHRRYLQVGDDDGRVPSHVRQRYFFFYGGFHAQFWWWEFLNFCFKVTLTVISTKAELESQPAQLLFFATGVVLAYCMADFKYAPYRRSLEVRLVRLTNFALLGLMLAAQGLNVGMLTGDEGFQSATRLLAGAGTLGVVVVFTLVFTQQLWTKYLKRPLPFPTRGHGRIDGDRVIEGGNSGDNSDAMMQHENPMLKDFAAVKRISIAEAGGNVAQNDAQSPVESPPPAGRAKSVSRAGHRPSKLMAVADQSTTRLRQQSHV